NNMVKAPGRDFCQFQDVTVPTVAYPCNNAHFPSSGNMAQIMLHFLHTVRIVRIIHEDRTTTDLKQIHPARCLVRSWQECFERRPNMTYTKTIAKCSGHSGQYVCRHTPRSSSHSKRNIFYSGDNGGPTIMMDNTVFLLNGYCPTTVLSMLPDNCVPAVQSEVRNIAVQGFGHPDTVLIVGIKYRPAGFFHTPQQSGLHHCE